MNNLKIKGLLAKRGSKPFVRWWWFADPIKKEDISYQIEWLAENGFGGVEIAWVYPSKRSTHPEEFLSSKWGELVTFAYRECEKSGIICDLTFGTLWPFGGSFITEEYASKTWEGLSKQRIGNSWESAYSKEPRRVLDHLNREALSRYAEKMIKGFKNILDYRADLDTPSPSAFFCDSLEVETTGLWTDKYEELFIQQYGYSIKPYMNELDKYPHHRFLYRQIISKLFLAEFFVPYTEICSDNGMLSRVQAHGALTDILKAFSLCDIPESEALLFDPEFSFIPASAAALSGKQIISCETFTCLYGWVPSPEKAPYIKEEKIGDLKLLADALFAAGVNHIIWHGMPYNGKNDVNEFYASVHVGRDGTLSPYLKSFNNYMSHISGVMQQGDPYTSIAVYLPLEDMQMLNKVPVEKQKPSSMYYWENHDIRWSEHLDGYHPMWISTPFLEEAEIDNNGTIHIGKTIFDAVYVEAEWITYKTLKALLKIAEAGGIVILDSDPKEPGTIHHNGYPQLLDKLKKHSIKSADSLNKVIDPFFTDLDNTRLPLYRCRINSENTVTCFIANPDARGLTYPMEYGKALKLKEHHRRFRFAYKPPNSEATKSMDYTAIFNPGESKLISINFSENGNIAGLHCKNQDFCRVKEEKTEKAQCTCST